MLPLFLRLALLGFFLNSFGLHHEFNLLAMHRSLFQWLLLAITLALRRNFINRFRITMQKCRLSFYLIISNRRNQAARATRLNLPLHYVLKQPKITKLRLINALRSFFSDDIFRFLVEIICFICQWYVKFVLRTSMSDDSCDLFGGCDKLRSAIVLI